MRPSIKASRPFRAPVVTTLELHLRGLYIVSNGHVSAKETCAADVVLSEQLEAKKYCGLGDGPVVC